MTIAYIFEKAVEAYRKQIAQEANEAIKKSGRAGSLLLEITRNPRFRITANPRTTMKECFEIFDRFNLDWKEFVPYYEQALRDYNSKKKEGSVVDAQKESKK